MYHDGYNLTSDKMVRATVRRIGNSLGVIIPKAEADRKGLKEGDEVDLSVTKALTLKEIRGMFKDSEMSVDEINDLIDEGEDLG